jgi:hypothetical protein
MGMGNMEVIIVRDSSGEQRNDATIENAVESVEDEQNRLPRQ